MALIATQSLGLAGTAPSFTAAAAGDTARVGPHLYLEVKNASGSPITVTIAVPGNLATGDPYPDKQYTVAATNGERRIPLLKDYGDPANNGQAVITYSATSSVTRAVVQT